MKILLVHPGASMSTHDVYAGLREAMEDRGHTVYDYALDGRIERAGGWLMFNWKKGRKVLPRPTASDILYKAGEELVARALRVEPDWILVVSAMYLHPDVLVLLKRAHLRVSILFTESPYDDERQVRLVPYADVVWTNERTSAQKKGWSYVQHAYRPAVHRPDAPMLDMPAHDVLFVGTGFQERIDMLAGVDWSGIDFGLYGNWELLGSRHPLRKHLRTDYVRNENTTAMYRKAKIGLNLYRTSMGFGKDAPRITYAESLNPRAYELAATGCFSLSDYRPEVTEVFGDAVPTFSSPGELSDLVRKWLADDVGRAGMAARLPGLVAGHTWAARAAQIEDELCRASGIVAGSASHRPDTAAMAAGG